MTDKMELGELKGESSNTIAAVPSPAVVDTLPSKEAADSTFSTADDASEVDDGKGGKKKNKKKKGKDGEPVNAVGYFELYRFATPKEYFYISVAIIASIGTGIGQPLVALLMGDIMAAMGQGLASADDIIGYVVKFTIVGAGIFLASYLQMCFWTLSAENQVKRIREEYLHAILRQDIGWHDTGKQAESLTTRLNSDTQLIYDGMADKVGLALSSFVTFIAGFIIGFTRGWKLSLVLLSCVPLIGACAALMTKFTVANASKGQDSYSRAGSIAEQAISSIRTIVAFGGQKRETASYIKELDAAFLNGKKRAIATGAGVGGFMLILFSTYGLAFWYGAQQVFGGHMTGGEVINVFFGMIIGAFALGNIGPNVAAFASAQGAAYQIFKTIDRVPTIDSANPGGAKPENVTGHIVVRDIDFHYPSRTDVPILKKMSIEVKPGQTVALVGHSGSGKSTIVGLVQRFYDPI
ncbi:ATP-binding cassette, sub-B (MDR TAP), member 4, partial [Linnemannia exigua]